MPEDEDINKKIFQALIQIQSNRVFFGQKENVINDGLRDRLSMVFDCHDQTRQGSSENEVDAGSVDLLIKHLDVPISIIESIRLDSLRQERIRRHIIKVLDNYDPNGCRITNLVIYAMMVDFSGFWKKLLLYLNTFEYPYDVVEEVANINTGLAEIKHSLVVLNREGTEVSFHVYAVHMRK